MMRNYHPGMLFAVVVAFASQADAAPRHVYLTYQDNPSTSIMVNFQTEQAPAYSRVFYDTESRDGKVDEYAHEAGGDSEKFEGITADRRVHAVGLTELEADTTYYFVCGGSDGAMSTEFSFRTAPAGDEPVRFITGGDMDVASVTLDIMKIAGEYDPLFAVIGGDLAYGNGDLRNYRKWDRWLDNWDEAFTKDGRLVPMVLAIGNHEVADSYMQPVEKAPFISRWFAQEAGDRTHFTRQFGENMVLFVLDTNHVADYPSQAEWLQEEFPKYEDVPHTMAVYHVPLYPTHRDFLGSGSVAGREHWGPVFDEFGLEAAFENHDHMFKRTHPLRNNEIVSDGDGTVYFGDGCFGKVPRVLGEHDMWYIVEASSTVHFWLVDVTKQNVHYRAVNDAGEVFHEYQTKAEEAIAGR